MPITRRDFLKGVGAAVAIAGTTSLDNTLIPFVRQPEDLVQGVSTWYATACRECPGGCGMLVKTRDTRALKCEGNPIHPINQGRLCARGQASVQGLYDPDRVKSPMHRKGGDFKPVTWQYALESVGKALSGARNVALVSDLQTTSLRALMQQWLSTFGSGRLVIYEPISYGTLKATNGGVVPSYDIAGSDFLLSFDADFLGWWISPVQYAREFTAIRNVKDGSRAGFVFVGPRVSMTAVSADRRLIVPPGSEESVAMAILRAAGKGSVGSGFDADAIGRRFGLDPNAIREVGRRLAAAKSPLALPGIAPGAARAAAIVNSAMGTSLVDRGRPHALTDVSGSSEMGSLISDMEAGKVDALLVNGANPAYSLPDGGRFLEAMERVPLVVSLSSFMDETSARVQWILPSSTPLESWGDYEPYPGIVNIMQPVMGTVHDTMQTGDILISLARNAGSNVFGAADFYRYLRNRWGAPLAPGQTAQSVSPAWEGYVQLGGKWPNEAAPDVRSIVPVGNMPAVTTGIAASPSGPILSPTGAPLPTIRTAPTSATPVASGTATPLPTVLPARTEGISLYAYPHIYYYDGRGANKRWLQELPEPVIRAVWGSWAELHPSTAKRLGVETDDVIEITRDGRSISLPAYVWEGVAPDTIAVPIGEGHEYYGRYAGDVGVNVYPLLATSTPTVTVMKTGSEKWVTRIKGGDRQYGRDVVKTTELGKPFEREEEIRYPLPRGYKYEDFYPGHEYREHRWAMAVDLNRCIGCHACVAACYAENNVATVGPEGIWRRRDMFWIRIDRYFDWDDPSAPILFEPMLCQQCGAAPCEPVCPVYASAQNKEGINMQVYNRCVGTRFCSNNCPYKVRRFNWFDYKWPEPLNWQLNPDVTVRQRGVMEKCTFCIQRIRRAELVALREGRPMRDGEVVPACVETCPAGVFTFGDLKDPDSAISRVFRSDPRAYQVLSTLNTKPAIVYLKRVVDRAEV